MPDTSNPPHSPNCDEEDRQNEIAVLLGLNRNGIIQYDPRGDRIVCIDHPASQQLGYAIPEVADMPGRTLFGEAGVAILREIYQRMELSDHTMVWGQSLAVRNRDGVAMHCFFSIHSRPAGPGPDSPIFMWMALENVGATGVDHIPYRQFILDTVQNGLWEYDMASGRFNYSRNVAGIMDRNTSSVNDAHSFEQWAERIHPDDEEMVFRNWRQLLKFGKRYRQQYRMRDSDGTWRWILSTPHAIVNDAEGRMTKVFGFQLDITHAVTVEPGLTDAEEHLRMIFENSGIGIALARPDGALVKVNPALAVMLGLDQGDMEGRRLSEFAHPDDREELRCNLGRLIEHGRREEFHAKRFLRSDGGELLVNLTATLSKSAGREGRRVVLILEDVTERQLQQDRLRYAATHDVMTGAWARPVLLDRLNEHLQLAIRHGQPLAFCICDIDRFKRVNDRHGHQVGDQVLVEFVKTIKASVRETDLVGRYGGEEFGIILPGTTAEGAAASLERVRERFAALAFADAAGNHFRVTATFGIAIATASSTQKSIIAEADAALYTGKRQGRDQVVVYNS